MQVKPIKKVSTASKVFETLYEMIVSGQFERGQKLPSQEELARQFGVSRNTLREAMNKLYAMGLLSSHQGIGTVVESPNPEGYLSALSSQFLLDALSYGCPPHGGIAFGLDRLVMFMAGVHTIRDVMAFPKTQTAACLLTQAPSTVSERQLRELHIKLRNPPKPADA